MRIISRFFVCFFLLISLMGAKPAPSIPTRLESLEQRVKTCTKSEVSQLSRSLSDLGRELYQKKEPLNKQLVWYTQRLQKLEIQKQIGIKEHERIKAKMALYLLQEQKTYPKPSWGVFSCQEQTLKKSVQDQEKLKRYWEKLHQTKLQIQLDLDVLKEYDKRVQQAQNTLFTRFQEKDGYRSQKGVPNDPHKVIQGTKGLPVYGSMHASKQETAFSCLEEEGTISQTSLFWSKVADSMSISAGTWQYPHGGLHLGMDLALPLYSKIYAPANGIVLYADTPCASDGGYLGNMEGWPYGGGNTLCVIVSVDQQLYALSFAHLSHTIQVSAGQQFGQGDVLALSGNSGNSSGPHTHVEIFELHVSLEEAIQYFMQGADFSFGCGWKMPATNSYWASRKRPEEIIL